MGKEDINGIELKDGQHLQKISSRREEKARDMVKWNFVFCLLLLVVGVLIGVGDFGGGGNVGLGVKAAVKSSI